MLNNRLYKIDKWLVSGNRVFAVLLFVAISAGMMQAESTMFIGIGLMSLICLWTVMVRIKVVNGQLKFDKSIYTIPIIGETIVVQKDFKYDCAKVKNTKNYIYGKAIQNINKGFEFDVINIDELSDDWIIQLSFNGSSKIDPIIIEVFWLDVKDYFMTISDIRDQKLTKLLK